MNRFPAHMSLAFVIVFIATIIAIGPADRIDPILDLARIITHTTS